MGEKVYVARQDTLLEVQQTVNKTDTTIGNIGDPAGENSVVALSKGIKKGVDSLAGQKPKMLVPSDNLKFKLLEKELTANEYDHVFIGFARFDYTGFVKVKIGAKVASFDSSYGKSRVVMSKLVYDESGDTLSAFFPDNIPQQGDKGNGSGSPVINEFYFQSNVIASITTSSYTDITTCMYVTKDELYAFILTGANRSKGTACNKVEFYFDEVEAQNKYGS